MISPFLKMSRSYPKISVLVKIAACDNLTRSNTISISRTKVTAGEAEVAAHNLSTTKRLGKKTFLGWLLIKSEPMVSLIYKDLKRSTLS